MDTKPLNYNDLDLELVAKIAKNELDLIADEDFSDFDDCTMSNMLAKNYLKTYLSEPRIFVKPVVNTMAYATQQHPNIFAFAIDEHIKHSASNEFVIGYAIAHIARQHACYTLDSALDDFVGDAYHQMTYSSHAPLEMLTEIAGLSLSDARLNGDID